MNTVNLIAALATIAALILAVWQYAEGRRRTRTERERLAAQSERLRLISAAAIVTAEMLDHIVQRTKEADVTMSEIRSLARASRRQATGLFEQLRDEDTFLRSLPIARTVVSASNPAGPADPRAQSPGLAQPGPSVLSSVAEPDHAGPKPQGRSHTAATVRRRLPRSARRSG